LLAVAVQTDGKIVAAGSATFNNNSDFAVARYNPDGSLDPSFGSGGIVFTDIGSNNDQINAIALQGDGRIVVAGIYAGDFALARYCPNGLLDRTFGNGG